MSQKKRRQYFIKPRFQFRIAFLILLIAFIFANITGGLIYLFLNNQTLFAGAQAWLGFERSGYVLLSVVIVAEIVGMLAILLVSLFVSHSVAGPIHRIETLAEEIGKGDLTLKIQIRKGDEFQDLAMKLDAMVNQIRSRIDSIKEVANDISRSKKELVKISSETGNKRLAALTRNMSDQLTVISDLLESMKTV